MFQICRCGAMSGYPHRPECPFPMYGEPSPARNARWIDERQALREAIARQEAAEVAAAAPAWDRGFAEE